MVLNSESLGLHLAKYTPFLGLYFDMLALVGSNEGWVGGKATGFPPCWKLFKTEGFENAVPLRRDE